MAAKEATAADVERMVELADNTRREYEPHAPVFQRPAANAREVHRLWLSKLIENPEVGTFVHEDSDGDVDGFAIITTMAAPPVFAPGGLSSLIDDFAVSSPDKWVTAGANLLNAATAWARERGAVQVVVVSGPHDEPKRAVLQDAGMYVASECSQRRSSPDESPCVTHHIARSAAVADGSLGPLHLNACA